MCELEEKLGSHEVSVLLLAPVWCLPMWSPPEAAVALVVLFDQSNALIGSRVVPHTPLNSPALTTNLAAVSLRGGSWSHFSPLLSSVWFSTSSGLPRTGPSHSTSRHQTPIVILLRQPVDVSHPQEIGSWSWSEKNTVIFLNVKKAGDELWLSVGSGWWVAGEGCGEVFGDEWIVRRLLMQRLQRLLIYTSSAIRIPSTSSCFGQTLKQTNENDMLVFSFLFSKVCLSAGWWFAAKWRLAPVSVWKMTAHQIDFHRHWTWGAHFSRKREKQAWI